MKATPCELCGIREHLDYEDGIAECRDRLLEQRDDARAQDERNVAMANQALRDSIRLARFEAFGEAVDLFFRGETYGGTVVRERIEELRSAARPRPVSTPASPSDVKPDT